MFVRDGFDFWLYGGGKTGDDTGIDFVGFSQYANGLGISPDADGIDHDNGKIGLVTGEHEGVLMAPCGFDHNAFDVALFQHMNDLENTFFVVRNLEMEVQRMQDDIEFGFADIYADVDADLAFRVHGNKLTLPCYAGSGPR